MRITKPATLLLVASLFLASGQSSNAVAESAALNAEREISENAAAGAREF